MITIDDFKKLEVKIGTIVRAEKVEGADKLLKLIVDLGEADSERQVLAGVALAFPDPSVLVGKQVPILTNLEPRTMRGEVSNGMMLASDSPDGPVLLHPAGPVPPGSLVK